jgi:hypothetical protein
MPFPPDDERLDGVKCTDTRAWIPPALVLELGPLLIRVPSPTVVRAEAGHGLRSGATGIPARKRGVLVIESLPVGRNTLEVSRTSRAETRTTQHVPCRARNNALIQNGPGLVWKEI